MESLDEDKNNPVQKILWQWSIQFQEVLYDLGVIAVPDWLFTPKF